MKKQGRFMYPAALARSLAALRRSALYGSRTDTHRFAHNSDAGMLLYTCQKKSPQRDTIIFNSDFTLFLQFTG